MKKILLISSLIISIIIAMIFPLFSVKGVATNADDYEALKIYVFKKEDDKKSQELEDWLNEFIKEKINLNVEYLDKDSNEELITKVKKELSIKPNKYPLVIIGSNYFIGFNDEIKEQITEAVNKYQEHDSYCNLVTKIQNEEDITNCLTNNKGIYNQVEYKTNTPWLLIGIVVGIVLVIGGVIIVRRIKK